MKAHLAVEVQVPENQPEKGENVPVVKDPSEFSRERREKVFGPDQQVHRGNVCLKLFRDKMY